jgi:hypothetical protein
MYLGDIIFASKILEDPDLMDRVDDPYVVVMPDTGFLSVKNKNVIKVMTLMHGRGWETVSTSFDSHVGLVALLKNPRAKNKNQPETEG